MSTSARNIPPKWFGSDAGSFAEHTVKVRLPNIARQVLRDNSLEPEIVQRLESLIHEIPDKPLQPLADPHAPDNDAWNQWIGPYRSLNWLEAPWMFVEVYFFRRILEASGYFTPGPRHNYDPYEFQKRTGLELSRSAVHRYCDQLQEWISHNNHVDHHETLANLLQMNLWGNQFDLSLWPAGVTVGPQRDSPLHSGNPQNSHILANQSFQLARYLIKYAGQDPEIDFVLDNAGLELVHDLGLADYLLTYQMAGFVRFHLKSQPFYVSDAMAKDVLHTLDWLAAERESATQALATRLYTPLQSGRLRLEDDPFWCMPISYWQNPGHFQGQIQNGAVGPVTLIILKGDLNYRRLLDDRRWPLITPVNEAFPDLQTPLAALRVLKSELAVGLPADLIIQADQEDPQWMISGRWGIIQLNA